MVTTPDPLLPDKLGRVPQHRGFPSGDRLAFAQHRHITGNADVVLIVGIDTRHVGHGRSVACLSEGMCGGVRVTGGCRCGRYVNASEADVAGAFGFYRVLDHFDSPSFVCEKLFWGGNHPSMRVRFAVRLLFSWCWETLRDLRLLARVSFLACLAATRAVRVCAFGSSINP